MSKRPTATAAALADLAGLYGWSVTPLNEAFRFAPPDAKTRRHEVFSLSCRQIEAHRVRSTVGKIVRWGRTPKHDELVAGVNRIVADVNPDVEGIIRSATHVSEPLTPKPVHRLEVVPEPAVPEPERRQPRQRSGTEATKAVADFIRGYLQASGGEAFATDVLNAAEKEGFNRDMVARVRGSYGFHTRGHGTTARWGLTVRPATTRRRPKWLRLADAEEKLAKIAALVHGEESERLKAQADRLADENDALQVKLAELEKQNRELNQRLADWEALYEMMPGKARA